MNIPRPPKGTVPLLGQQTQQAQQALNAAIGQLAMGIYQQVAIQHLVGRDNYQPVDEEYLKSQAQNAKTAAVSYFTGLGVAQEEKKQ